jgi:hypothetical protein
MQRMMGRVAIGILAVVTILLVSGTPLLLFGAAVAGLGAGEDGVNQWHRSLIAGAGIYLFIGACWGLVLWRKRQKRPISEETIAQIKNDQ